MHSHLDLQAVEKRAERIRQAATNEISVYLKAIEEYVMSKRKSLGLDQADQLETSLLVYYGFE
ncbi:hypothetical protein [Shouchella shacheensis]|uniref:hypothetical protein n=1 Tax=Shouchella shacheensis TaxID=1649580 RepID=UPI00073FF36C|nr:hypothetical protein [Shouchella shacheensis]